MFRIIVSVLAAFVGFSFGHSIPKWMENKSRSATEMPSSESAHPVRKLPLRRKSLRKFKFGFQKSGKENLENDESLQQLSKDNAEGNGSSLKGSQNSPLCASTRVVRAEHKKFKFGSQKSLKEKSTFKVHESSPIVPLSDVDVDNGSRAHQDVSTIVDNGRRSLQEMRTKPKMGHCLQQELRAEVVSPVESKLQEPVFCKISSVQSMCGSPPAKEKSQMKQWKMKLMSLRSKAMASEKVWYEKFDNENYGGKLLAHTSSRGTPKKQATGKENESPQLATSTKKRELSWSRCSSSKVGLLVEGPKIPLER